MLMVFYQFSFIVFNFAAKRDFCLEKIQTKKNNQKIRSFMLVIGLESETKFVLIQFYISKYFLALLSFLILYCIYFRCLYPNCIFIHQTSSLDLFHKSIIRSSSAK